MRSLSIYLLTMGFSSLVAVGSVSAEIRNWQDKSGQYRVTANFITADDKLVVLEKEDGELEVFQRDQLSPHDQEYIAEQLAVKKSQDGQTDEPPKTDSTWHLIDGSVINGQLVGFGNQKLIVRRERGKLFVNDHALTDLPSAYEKILPIVVSGVDDKPIVSLRDLESHLADGGGGPFEYVVEGIQLNLEAGGMITIPMELLTSEDAKQVAPNFKRWKAAHDDDVSEPDRYAADRRERLILDSYQRLRQANAIRQRQLKMMELGLLGVATGIIDVWEVTMYPNDSYGYPQSVVVSARDSLAAQEQAQQRYPGWRLGPIRKLSN